MPAVGRWRATAVVSAALWLVACTTQPKPPSAASPQGAPAAAAATGGCVPAGRWVDPATRAPLAPAEVVARSVRARVVLLGEQHETPDHHRWQLQTLAAVHAAHPDLVVGFEAFPRRVQPVLDRWVAGTLDERTFLVDSDWSAVWGYDASLSLPLFHFARLNAVPVRALNVERTLIARVGEAGFAAVPAAEREGVGAPAPASPTYAALLAEVFDAHPTGAAPADEAARARFVEAQLTWDRAMAEALASALAQRPAALVVGIMGSGHLERRLGVPYQLAALGVRDVAVLLPWDTDRDCAQLTPDLADAVFGVADTATGGHPAPGLRLGVLLAPGDGGVRVTEVTSGSVAEAAGLRPGDVVESAAGVAIRAPGDLRAVVERQAPGTWLPVALRRKGRLRTVVAKFPADARAAERPAAEPR